MRAGGSLSAERTDFALGSMGKTYFPRPQTETKISEYIFLGAYNTYGAFSEQARDLRKRHGQKQNLRFPENGFSVRNRRHRTGSTRHFLYDVAREKYVLNFFFLAGRGLELEMVSQVLLDAQASRGESTKSSSRCEKATTSCYQA